MRMMPCRNLARKTSSSRLYLAIWNSIQAADTPVVWRVILTFFQKTNSAGQMLIVL
jgi:hypothetical protein